MNGRRLLAAGLVLILAVSGAVAWTWSSYLEAPLPVVDEVLFELPPGRGLSPVAADLHRRGLLPKPRLFVIHARLTGQAGRLQAGEYRIGPGETPRSLLRRLVAGDVYLRSVTLIEGWTFRQARRHLQAQPALRDETASLSREALLAELWPDGTEPPGDSLEGWVFPDTYVYHRGSSDMDILRRGVETMRRELAAAWAERAADLPLATPYEALILASIIEKETALDTERGQVAGVMIRRLERGMRLQTDPTVIYGLGDAYDGDIRRADLNRDTPYNTYTRAGLPPTPIALPGRASLRAAVMPADGDSLYFVATGEPDGSHYFSATLEEHNKAVRRYLNRRAGARSDGP